MSSVNYHAVIAFAVGTDGVVVPVVEEASVNPAEAVLLARRLGKAYAGAIAFSRTMDVGQGRYGLANVHAVEGLIPNDLAPMCGERPSKRHSGCAAPSRKMPKPQSRIDPVSVVVRPDRWRR